MSANVGHLPMIAGRGFEVREASSAVILFDEAI
jgi:hypothetical protein